MTSLDTNNVSLLLSFSSFDTLLFKGYKGYVVFLIAKRNTAKGRDFTMPKKKIAKVHNQTR